MTVPSASTTPRAIVLNLVAQHGLCLKVIGIEEIEADPEFGRVTRVLYTAPARVDFRALVVDLARALKCRIDMRQIGDREVAGRLGGVGVCGQCLCCATWLTRPLPVPVSLTRGLATVHEPERVVGVCGRLMCCLRYEASEDDPSEARSAADATSVRCPCRRQGALQTPGSPAEVAGLLDDGDPA
jgi:cell fate regulator YaaT (PSP1 superfamily)